jgi:glycosyltransferase involved in cell wall biosynthesis
MIGEGLKKSGYDTELLYNKRNNSYITFALHLAFRLLISFNKPRWIIARSTDGVFCALLSKLPGFNTKVILHNHGWEEKALELEKSLSRNLITNPTTWKSTIIRFPLLRLNLRFVRYCMSGTVEESRWIASKYRKGKYKIAVIPNGITIDSKPFWPLKDAYPPGFLMVGGCTWKKNIEYGISVFNAVKTKIPDASLHIIGTCKSAMKMCTFLPDNGSIHFYEKVDPDKMNDYYERCPFLLFTSRYEGGHAFTILEAQAKGMVAFVTNIPSTSEIVSDKKTGCFISGNDPQEDAALIEQVCTDPARIKQIGTAAFKNATRHRIDRQIQRLETLLSKEK